MVPVANARYLAEHIPGATFETVPDGRHGFFDEFQDRVSIGIQRFLRDWPEPSVLPGAAQAPEGYGTATRAARNTMAHQASCSSIDLA